MELTWYRYHLAVVQPEHLVLVFHGLVIAIPNDALPEKPETIGTEDRGLVRKTCLERFVIAPRQSSGAHLRRPWRAICAVARAIAR